VVQAAAIAYAVFGLDAWIDGGGVLDKATQDSDSTTFAGVGGFVLHGINGEMVIPALTILLLVVSFFAEVPRGVMWAAVTLCLVVVQVLLGVFSHSLIGLGILHGMGALAIFGVAVMAAMATRARRRPPRDPFHGGLTTPAGAPRAQPPGPPPRPRPARSPS